MDKSLRLAVGSIVIGALVLALKYGAYRATGSIALLSDALESIINVAAAVAALLAVRLSAKPADEGHHYGHHKAEYFSAVFEGVLIVLAAVAIFRQAYYGFLSPRPIDAPLEGLLLNGLAALINGSWAWLLIRYGRSYRSPALVADGRHLFTDVLSSVGVLLGVLVAALSGWVVLDSILAALVGINVLWSGWQLVKESVGGLMDNAPPAEDLEKIRSLIGQHAVGAIEAHDLRARQAGRATFIDFHLVVPGGMSVSEAHSICDDIERALKSALGDANVTIHLEPEGKAKHRGIVVL